MFYQTCKIYSTYSGCTFVVMFSAKFLSFYRKVLRKAPQSFFALWSMLPISSREQEKVPRFTDST
ncbi:hypothetical protein C7N43_11395 [Sphingobacteriales bacterium UPWRP_1]|nr:hypothetical protein C7N43_11395 [Sphingobacteriales bacterium UPWRP_1]